MLFEAPLMAPDKEADMDYDSMTESELLAELRRRGIPHGVSSRSFPVDAERTGRLRSILSENDRWRGANAEEPAP